MTQPRFDLHERVETPKDGIGRIVTIWPNKGRGQPSYGVALDGRTAAVTFDQDQLRSAPPITQGAVYCRDCDHGAPSRFAPGSRHCRIYRRAKAANSPRQCPDFKPREAA